MTKDDFDDFFSLLEKATDHLVLKIKGAGWTLAQFNDRHSFNLESETEEARIGWKFDIDDLEVKVESGTAHGCVVIDIGPYEFKACGVVSSSLEQFESFRMPWVSAAHKNLINCVILTNRVSGRKTEVDVGKIRKLLQRYCSSLAFTHLLSFTEFGTLPTSSESLYEKDGIKHVRNALSPDVIYLLRNRFVCKAENSFSIGAKDFANGRQQVFWQQLDNNTDLYNSLINNEDLKGLICSLLGENRLPVAHYMKYVKQRQAGGVGVTNESWHRDSVVGLSVRVLYYLTDVTEVDDGAFSFKRGTQRYANDHGAITSILAPAGTAVIVDVSGLHRAEPAINCDRITAQVLYMSPASDHIAHMFQISSYTFKEVEAYREGRSVNFGSLQQRPLLQK